MRITIATSVLALLLVSSLGGQDSFAAAKKPSRSSSGASRRPSSSRGRGGSNGGGRPKGPPPRSKARRKTYEDEYDNNDDDDDDELPFGFPDDDEEEDEADSDAAYEDEYDDEPPRPSARRPSGKRGPPMTPPSRKGGRGSGPSRGRRGGPPPRGPPARGRGRYDDNEDDYDGYEDEYRPSRGRGRGGPSRSHGGRPGGRGARGPPGRRGSVVPYGARQPPSAFSRGLSAIRDRVPDVNTVKNAAVSSVAAAKQTTSKLSSNVYREIKGLTSSELEQVMLKATRPDDDPVKGKHVERLVGVTYQISGRYDIYDAVLRKLWNKMAEKDWRTTLKSLYILHRFSADGAPDHQASLKARLRELRRSRDPKRKGEKYFNSKALLEGDVSPETQPFIDFMSRYSHYVLLRAQCFGGMFNEISPKPSTPSSSSSRSSRSSKSAAASNKPITSTALRPEHLEAAQLILKAGCACSLEDGEVCESTAMCLERVVSDLIGLTTATATALNRVLKGGRDAKGADPAVVKKWCEFYSEELLPQTKGLMKKATPELDAFGMFLPARMGAAVSGELLKKGLQGGEEEEEQEEEEEKPVAEEKEEKKSESKPSAETATAADAEEADDALEDPEDEDAYDEYSYDEYYDDEEA